MVMPLAPGCFSACISSGPSIRRISLRRSGAFIILGNAGGIGAPADGGDPADTGDISGVCPPEYQTGIVKTASLLPETSESVEFVAPATNPPVALVAPVGFGEIVVNVRLGVVSIGIYGPQP